MDEPPPPYSKEPPPFDWKDGIYEVNSRDGPRFYLVPKCHPYALSRLFPTVEYRGCTFRKLTLVQFRVMENYYKTKARNGTF